MVNRRVGGADIMAAVRQALLVDIFVLMTRSYPFRVADWFSIAVSFVQLIALGALVCRFEPCRPDYV